MIGVQITLKWLDIDIDLGDFLLIGPGSQLTHRELSKAQIIAQKIKKKSKIFGLTQIRLIFGLVFCIHFIISFFTLISNGEFFLSLY
jgi:hypothetical protein